jgi:Ca2+/Na+ antiporter
MPKRKRQTIQFVLCVFFSWSLYFLSFPLGHCTVCLFLLVIVLSVFSCWSLYCLLNDQEEKTDNTMTKRKRQTMQWPRGKDRQYNEQEEKTDNTMTKRKRQTIQWSKVKDRQYNDQEVKTDNTKTLSFPFGHCIVCLFLLVFVLSVVSSWSLYCLVFSSWSLYCLSFPLGHCIVCFFLLEEKTDNAMTKRKRQTI